MNLSLRCFLIKTLFFSSYKQSFSVLNQTKAHMSWIALFTNSVSILFEVKYLIKDKRTGWGKTHSVFYCEKSEHCSVWDSVQNGYFCLQIWLFSLISKGSSTLFFSTALTSSEVQQTKTKSLQPMRQRSCPIFMMYSCATRKLLPSSTSLFSN